jgi:hypothetical protein
LSKKKYIYVDSSQVKNATGKGTKIVFQCDAESITEADHLYQEKFGQDPAKVRYLGVIPPPHSEGYKPPV